MGAIAVFGIYDVGEVTTPFDKNRVFEMSVLCLTSGRNI